MRNDQFDHCELVEQLIFGSDLQMELFKDNLKQKDIKFITVPNDSTKKSLIFSIIETLVIEEKFYQTFTLNSFKTSDYVKQQNDLQQSKILQFGYGVIEEIFSRDQLIQNDNLYLSQTLKKCKMDIFLLMAVCKGYLKNPKARRDKVRSMFLQSFKKNSNEFFGIQRLCSFHQCLVQKSSSSSLYLLHKQSKQRSTLHLLNFLSFYTPNKDFFPSTLQHQNNLFKLMFTLKIESSQDTSVYQQFQTMYINDNQYHLTTTCKNIRFLMEFFRCGFNQKVGEFYPQKSFVRLLGRYTQGEIQKIVSFSEVGLTWGQEEISTCIGNLFKLGLTTVTLHFLKALINLWLRGGLVDILLKLCQTYIPKTFIFLKHQKLFDISLNFLNQFTLGPRTPTIGIMNKVLQKILPFYQKDCPILKKQQSYQFLCLIQAKYQKTATLEDKLYVELKNTLKAIRQNEKRQLLKDQQIKEKLKGLQWQEAKVPLFGTRLQGVGLAEKQAGEYRGLYNVGNSCYMNSFLQCLYMNIEFREKVLEVSTLGLEKNVLQKLHQVQAKGDKIIQQKSQTAKNIALQARQSVRPVAQLQRLFAQLSSSKRPCITPTQIKNVSSAQFKNTFQQDTIEFGRSFLDYVSRSSLQNMFEGQQTNEIICPNCKQSRYKKENFLDLMLTEVTDEQRHDDRASTSTKDSGNDSLTVDKMLHKFFQPQQIQNLTCDNCNTKSQKSIKKHLISKYPNYLILTLKRFCYDIKQNKNMKKHYAVDLKEGMIRVESQMYQLYGIIVHRGQSANSGHYFAFCREWRFGEGVGVGMGVQEMGKYTERQEKEMGKDTERQSRVKDQVKQMYNGEERMRDQSEEVVEVQKESYKMQIEGHKQQQSHLLRQQQLKNQTQEQPTQPQPQSNLNFPPINHPRWLCLNDSTISPFPSFQSIKQFLQLNQQDTPYILFYQKVSHITQPAIYNYLKQPIKLRQPLEKFIEKDNVEYQKFVENKKKGNTGNRVDWRNFGKVKGFTAYDYFKFTKDQDQDEGNGGFGTGSGGFQPIL